MENKRLTLGSLFSGSGGFELGAVLSGITPIFNSEVEPFPIRVTTKRFPNIKHLGDVNKIDGSKIPPVDIITFGSPCQDMSIAGKRNGLSGERSSLFYQAIRIIKEMREKTNGKYPRFVVWENVPGAFSSNQGEDFKAVLEEICKIKYDTVSIPKPQKWTKAGKVVGDDFSLAFRVFDSQYWGVPQRRKRIYLVADFASQCAEKILFESKSVSGDFKKSRNSRKTTSTDTKKSFGKSSCGIDGYNADITGDVCSTLGENCGVSTGRTGVMVLNDQGGERMDVTKEITSTLRAKANHPPLVFENHSQDCRYTGPQDTSQTVLATFGTGGNNQPFVVETPKTLKIRSGCDGGGKGALIQENKSATLGCNNDQTLFVPKTYGICSKDSNSMKSANPHSGFYEAETTRTLDSTGGNPSCNQGGMAVVSLQGSMIGRTDNNGPQGSGINEDVSFTLNTTDHHAVAYGIARSTFNQSYSSNYGLTIDEEVQPTIIARGPGAVAKPVYSSCKASFFTNAEKELANTLVATDYKDPPLVNDNDGAKYIVRRLTPTECARLQGFPDWWCSNLNTDEPTSEDIEFWKEVFETQRKILGKSKKAKTDKQIIKWLKSPHSDSAEYKMWGNGVSIQIVYFILSRIVKNSNNLLDNINE